jgi:hypothetical protein
MQGFHGIHGFTTMDIGGGGKADCRGSAAPNESDLAIFASGAQCCWAPLVKCRSKPGRLVKSPGAHGRAGLPIKHRASVEPPSKAVHRNLTGIRPEFDRNSTGI